MTIDRSKLNLMFWIMAAAVMVIVIDMVIVLLNSTTNRVVFQDESNNHQPSTTTLFLAGDIMLSRHVGTKMWASKNFTLPFESVRGITSSADISLANLESQFSDSRPRITEGLVFKAEPQAVLGLVSAGFDVLSTANNHSLDQ